MIEKGLGKAGNDLFAQFYFRIYMEIKGCKVSSFSTLKNCNGSNFAKFREVFPYKFLGGFIVNSKTFENTRSAKGFPVSFQVWDTEIEEQQDIFKFDVLKNDGEFTETKQVYNLKKGEFINDWFKTNNRSSEEVIGAITKNSNDFQNQNYVAISKKPTKGHYNANLYKSNLINGLIYLAVRWTLPATWINDRDQLLHPRKIVKKINEIQQEEIYAYSQDEFFIGNCVVFSLLHRQNGTAWALFKDSEISLHGSGRDLTIWDLATKGREFSDNAKNILAVAKQIYTLYYKNFKEINVGRNDIWQALKDNDEFKKLNKEFIKCQKILADEIADGMVEFGFLGV